MNSYGYVSVNTLIAKLYRDFNLQLEGRIADFMEWVGEAVEYMDATVQYTKKKTSVDRFEDYRYYLPCDLVEIDQVLINSKVAFFSNHTVLGNIKNDKGNSIRYNTRDNTYNRQDNCLVLSLKKGTIEVFYLGLATDENGFPLIVNNVRYLDAIINFILYKIKFAEGVSGRISAQEVQFYKEQWESSRVRAVAYISMPTPDQAISIGKQFQRLIPNIKASNTMYDDYASLERSR